MNVQLWQQLQDGFFIYFYFVVSFGGQNFMQGLQPAQKYVNYCTPFKLCQLDSKVSSTP